MLGPGVLTGGGGWRSRWHLRVDVDPELPAVLERVLDRLGRYLDHGGIDAPTWVSDMAALERRLENLAAGTRDRALHALLRDLLRQLSAVYLSAPGVDLRPHRVALGSLFDALESAEQVAGKALDRAVALQASTSGSPLPISTTAG